jgi:hypothetical protein
MLRSNEPQQHAAGGAEPAGNLVDLVAQVDPFPAAPYKTSL